MREGTSDPDHDPIGPGGGEPNGLHDGGGLPHIDEVAPFDPSTLDGEAGRIFRKVTFALGDVYAAQQMMYADVGVLFLPGIEISARQAKAIQIREDAIASVLSGGPRTVAVRKMTEGGPPFRARRHRWWGPRSNDLGHVEFACLCTAPAVTTWSVQELDMMTCPACKATYAFGFNSVTQIPLTN